MSFVPTVDLGTLLAIKALDQKFLDRNIARATRAYAAKQTRTYRYKGVTFRTMSAKGTDGWYNAWQRQRARNRKRTSTR